MSVFAAFTSPVLAACHAHVTGHGRFLRAAVDNEVMTLGLSGNRLDDGSVQGLVGGACPKRSAQISRVFLTKAHIQRARTSDANTIAAFTEIMS